MSNSQANHVGIGKEETYGVAVAPTIFLPTREVKGVTIDMAKQAVEAIKGTAPKNKCMYPGLVEINAEYEMDAYPQAITHLLYAALGAKSTALESGESTVYKHTLTESFTKPSYTIEEKFGEVVKRYAGFIPSEFTLSIEKGEGVTLGFSGPAKSQADATASTPSYETPCPYNFRHVTTFTIGSLNLLTIGLESAEVTYNNGVAPRHAIGDNYAKGMVPGASEFTGTITVYLNDESKALLADYIANTERSLEIKLEGETIGTAGKNTLRITSQRVNFTSVSEDIEDNYNVMEIEFEAVEDPSTGIVKIEVINTLTTI